MHGASQIAEGAAAAAEMAGAGVGGLGAVAQAHSQVAAGADAVHWAGGQAAAAAVSVVQQALAAAAAVLLGAVPAQSPALVQGRKAAGRRAPAVM